MKVLLYQFVFGVILSSQIKYTAQHAKEGFQFFGMDIFNAIEAKHNWTNVIISPTALQINLAVAFCFAKGETAKELSTAFNAGNFGEPTTMMSQMTPLIKSMLSTFYVPKKLQINEVLYNLTRKYFRTEKKVFERSYPDRSAERMNYYIKANTNNKIKDSIKRTDIYENLNGLFVHVVDFRVDWEDKFTYRARSNFSNETHSYETEMMILDPGYLPTGELLELKAFGVHMPLKNHDATLLLLKPQERGGLSDLRKKLQNVDLTEIKLSLKLNRVKLLLPILEIETEFSLRTPLNKLGVVRAFSKNDAAFPFFLSNKKNSYIKDLKHRAHLKLSAKGIEFYSATNIQWHLNSYPKSKFLQQKKPVSQMGVSSIAEANDHSRREIKMDHPFIYVIIRQKAILSVGEIRNVFK